MKKIAIVLLAVLMIACGIGLIACNSDAKVLEAYIFDKDGSTVTGEFELPRLIGEAEATWTSDSDLIKITDRSAEDKDYLATVTRPETEVTNVHLTVKVGKSTKTFTVQVNPIDVYDFSNSYKFPKDKALVTKNFDLDSKATFEGKEATITWSVKNNPEYTSYIKVENGKCVVTPSSLDPEVRITATFSYKGETTSKDYRMTVSIEKTALEAIDYWYNNTGVSVDIKGYVVSVGTAYSASYNNINLYVVDVEGRCGYYVYRVNLKNKDDGAKIKRGSYVEITGTTNTNYSGLIETNAGGQLVIDESKNITVEQLDAMCYSLDNDILGKVPEAIYHTSQYVSLEKWVVDSVADPKVKASDGVDNKDLFVLKKNNVTVTVKISKYLEDIYKDKSDKAFTDILALQDTLEKGDVVNIKGILGNSKGYTIMPIYASDVVKVDKSTADNEDAIKAMPGVKVGNFLTETYDSEKPDTTRDGFNAVIKNNNLNLIVTKDKTVTLPASTADVTVKYSILGTSSAIALDGNTLTISNISAHERVHLQADLTCGTYTTTVFQYIEVWNKSDDEMIADEHLKLYMDEDIALTAPSTTPLQNNGLMYGANVEITWAVKDPATHAYASILTDKDTGAQSLAISMMTLAEQKVTIVATIKVKGSNATPKTREFTFAIPNIVAKVSDPAESTPYKLVFNNTQLGKLFFARNAMSGFYIASTEDFTEADDVYIEKVKDGGVKLYFLKGKDKVYIGAITRDGKPANTSYNITLGGKIGVASGSSETTDPADGITVYDVWTMTDECFKINLNPEGTNEAFIGSYGANKTFSMSKISYLASGNYAAYLAEVSSIKDVTADAAATLAIGTLKVDNVSKAGIVDLPVAASYYSNPTTTWAIKGTTTVATVADNKLTVAALPAEKTTITLTATVKVGSVIKTTDVKVEIAAAPVVEPTINLDTAKDYTLVMAAGASNSYLVNEVASNYYVKGDKVVTNASVIKVESVTGGYRFYTEKDGTKTYINHVVSGTNHNLVPQTLATNATPTTWKVVESGIYSEVDEVRYYIGNTGTYANFSLTSSDSANRAAIVANDELLPKPAAIEVDTTKTYNLVMTAGSKTSYLVNEVASSYYVKGDETAANASVVKVEAVEGGYRLYTEAQDGTKTYINAVINGTNRNLVPQTLETAATPTVWTISANGIYVELAGDIYYIGNTGTYTNFSLTNVATKNAAKLQALAD